ncbi:MAG: hypothetical protein MR210_07070 [Erysipelotrichaceae bacterium]|nr:hypothetical protein [Erysipelotrichaceae bacterium]MDY5252181.1 hypothetical protein [Erysipelotrichaceae bacterium]
MEQKVRQKILNQAYILPSLLSSILFILLWSAILMIVMIAAGQLIYKSNAVNEPSLIIFFALLSGWIIIAIGLYLRMQKIRKSDTWQMMVKECYDAIQDNDEIKQEVYQLGTEYVAAYLDLQQDMHFNDGKGLMYIKKMKIDAKLVSLILMMPIIGHKRWMVLSYVLSSVIIIASFIPFYAQEAQAYAKRKELVIASIENVKASLETVCDEVYGDDPASKYHESGYYVEGIIDDEKHSVSIMFFINNEAKVTNVDYNFDIDPKKSKQENLDYIERVLRQLDDIIKNSDIKAAQGLKLTGYQLPEEFVIWFMNAPYDEEKSYYDEDSNAFVGYYALLDDSDDTYRLSYIYIGLNQSY